MSRHQSVAFVFVQRKGLRKQYQKYQKSKKSKRSISKSDKISHFGSNYSHSNSKQFPSFRQSRSGSRSHKIEQPNTNAIGLDYFFELHPESTSDAATNSEFRFTPRPKRNPTNINPLNKFTSNIQFETLPFKGRKLSLESIDSTELLTKLTPNHHGTSKAAMQTQNSIVMDLPDDLHQSARSNKSVQTMRKTQSQSKRKQSSVKKQLMHKDRINQTAAILTQDAAIQTVPNSRRTMKLSKKPLKPEREMNDTRNMQIQSQPEWIHPQVDRRQCRNGNDKITPKITELSANRYVTHVYDEPKDRSESNSQPPVVETSIVNNMRRDQKNTRNVDIDHSYPKSDLWSLQTSQQNTTKNNKGGPVAWSIPMGNPKKTKPNTLRSNRRNKKAKTKCANKKAK